MVRYLPEDCEIYHIIFLCLDHSTPSLPQHPSPSLAYQYSQSVDQKITIHQLWRPRSQLSLSVPRLFPPSANISKALQLLSTHANQACSIPCMDISRSLPRPRRLASKLLAVKRISISKLPHQPPLGVSTVIGNPIAISSRTLNLADLLIESRRPYLRKSSRRCTHQAKPTLSLSSLRK